MEMEDDPDYLSFLNNLRVGDNSCMFEFQPDGASPSLRVKYDEISSRDLSAMKPNRKSKRIRRDLSAMEEAVIEESGEERPGLESDSFRLGKKWRKDNKEEGLSERKKASKTDVSVKIGNEVIASVGVERENVRFEKESENPVRKDASVGVGDERVEIQSQDQEASPLSNSVTTDFQGFMLLMKMLCPIEKTIYPGWNNDSEDVIRPTVEPTKSKSMDFEWIEEKSSEVEAKSRRPKRNKRGNVEIETIPAFPELSDSDEEEAIMDDIPVEVLSRPPSEYKNRLIRELKRPFDKCEYKELMNKATLRNKKIVYKELRSVKNAVETKAARRVRERAIKTEEASKSFFNWYPEVETKVKRARIGRRLTLLRGFFFWLQNCSWEKSFKPWQKWRERSKVDLPIDSATPEYLN